MKQNHLLTLTVPQKIQTSSTEIEIQPMCAQEVKGARCSCENQTLNGRPMFLLQSFCGFKCLLLEALPQRSKIIIEICTVHQSSYLDLEKCTSSRQHNNYSYGYATHDQLIHFSSGPLSVSLKLKSSLKASGNLML